MRSIKEVSNFASRLNKIADMIQDLLEIQISTLTISSAWNSVTKKKKKRQKYYRSARLFTMHLANLIELFSIHKPGFYARAALTSLEQKPWLRLVTCQPHFFVVNFNLFIGE